MPVAFALIAWQFVVQASSVRAAAAAAEPWRERVVAIGLIVVTLLGAPLFAVIGASALLGFRSEGVDLSVVAIEFFGLSETPVLVAIPLFTFAGFLLSAGQAPRAARSACRRRCSVGCPGGLAIVSLVACALFTAFTGASGVTIIALGALLFPALDAGRLRRAFQPRADHVVGKLGPPVRAVAAADPLRHRRGGCRSTICSSPARCRAC